MPIKKGRNKRWWERWDPKQRRYPDARLTKILRSLDPPDALRLAHLIYEDVENARRMVKGLPALRERLAGRRHRKHGPERKVQASNEREFRDLYDKISSLVRSRWSAEELARELGCG